MKQYKLTDSTKIWSSKKSTKNVLIEKIREKQLIIRLTCYIPDSLVVRVGLEGSCVSVQVLVITSLCIVPFFNNDRNDRCEQSI